MRYTIAFVLAMVGLLVGCAAKAPLPVAFQIPMRPIDYMKEVKPLLDKRCMVCQRSRSNTFKVPPQQRKPVSSLKVSI